VFLVSGLYIQSLSMMYVNFNLIYFRPIRNIWEVTKAQTETSGLAHMKSAHQLFAELAKITEIGDQGRDKRRLKEESVRLVKSKFSGANYLQGVMSHYSSVV
jgi:hypothetical protein